jgi:lipopolysaccharide export system protein LptC
MQPIKDGILEGDLRASFAKFSITHFLVASLTLNFALNELKRWHLNSRLISPASVSRAARQVRRNNGDQVFREATRHTGLVRLLRYAIPALIVAIASVIFIATFLNPFRLITTFPIDPGKVSLSGTKIIMELPKVNGYTTDSRPYTMTAHTAVQDLTTPDILELKEIDSRIEMKDGNHVMIKSINGVYNTKSDVLKLNDHIVLTSTSGYEGHLSEATIYMGKGNVVSESPVEIKLPNDGLLNANRMEIRQNGDVIVFGGSVEMTVNPDQLHSTSQEEPSPTVPIQVSVPLPTARPSVPVARNGSSTSRLSGPKAARPPADGQREPSFSDGAGLNQARPIAAVSQGQSDETPR